MPHEISFSRRGTLIAGAVLAVAGFAVYANSLNAPFIFDDHRAIVDNPTIRHLWPLDALSPPAAGGTIGRPLVNFSFALNYALGGTSVRGYHVANVVIHVLAGLTLFGLVRRTLVAWRPGGREPMCAGQATRWAFAVAGLWLVHPLQTESVTCAVQRTESLFGLFYLLCLYACVRGAQSPSPRRWYVAAVLASLAGMATKEAMVTVPVVAFLYDRTFLSGSFAGAWRQRKALHAGLAATWLMLAYLVIDLGGSRQQAAGFGLGVTPWNYALTQCEAIVTYLRLSIWPQALVLDYGTGVVQHASQVIPQGLAVLALVAGTAFALWRKPVLGFLGAWFLIILAPSSSFIPLVTQTIAEHRMYLPLAAVIVLVVVALHACLGRWALPACLALALPLGWRTVERNGDYRSEIAIWADTVAKRPDNVRALNSLGRNLTRSDRIEEGMASLREALRLDPQMVEAHYNLGTALARLERFPEAAAEFGEAVRLDPANHSCRYSLAITLILSGRKEEGIGELKEVLRLHPEYTPARTALERAGAADSSH